MKFHRITLRDYRAIRSCVIEPLATGVTIIEGDNEVGKSSIAEALWLVFEQHDDSQSAAVRAIRPADRDAATEIEVEVTSGPYRFVYSKRFHRSPRTELRVLEPAREMLAGREAHNRALQILDDTMDRRLWEALRLQQGGSLDPLAAGKHHSLLSALDIAAGQLLGGDREKTLFERAQAEYERYFTATGRIRTSRDGADLASFERPRDAAKAEVQRLADLVAQHERSALRCEELDAEVSRISLELERASHRLRAAEEAEQARHAARTNADQLAAEVREAEAAWREAEVARRARATAIETIGERTRALDSENEALASGEAPLDAAVAAEEAALHARDAAARAVAEARDGLALAEEDLHLLQQELQATQMSERLQRLEQNEPELAEITAWLNACRVDRRLLAQIDEAERELAVLQGRRDSEAATLMVEAPPGAPLTIDGLPLQPGRPTTIRGESLLELPGGIRVTVRAGAHARQLEAAARDGEARLRELLRAAGVESREQAGLVLEERASRESRRGSLVEQIRADRRDLAGAAELRDKLAREQVRIAEVRASRPAGHSIPETLDTARAVRDAASSRVGACEQAHREAVRTLEAAAARRNDLQSARTRSRERVRSLEEELSRLRARIDAERATESDEALALRASAAAARVESVRGAHGDAAAALAAMPDSSAELAEATRETDGLGRRLRELELERAGLLRLLEEAGAAGLHHQLGEAQTRLEAAESALRAFQLRAGAARELFNALQRRRDEARENYAGPLRERIESLGRPVFGQSFAVELNDDLGIARRTIGGITLEFSQLSAGVREQLLVLYRLACAALVSEHGGAPLILDDIFGWADPGRLKRLGPVLAQAAADLQVLLFTCTPERFEAVAPARVVSLPSGAVHDRPGPLPADQALAPAPAAPVQLAPHRRPASPAAPTGAAQGALDLFASPTRPNQH